MMRMNEKYRNREMDEVPKSLSFGQTSLGPPSWFMRMRIRERCKKK